MPHTVAASQTNRACSREASGVIPFDDFSDSETKAKGFAALGLVEDVAGLRKPSDILHCNPLAGLCKLAVWGAYRYILDDEAVRIRLFALRSSRP